MSRPLRVLLKLSGESLCEPGRHGYSPARMEDVAREIVACVDAGVQIAVVVGAGNLFRGSELDGSRVVGNTADAMGMLGTVMNAAALRDVIRANGAGAEVLTGLRAPEVGDSFTLSRADAVLSDDRVLVLGGGTGLPYFTTDTAAVVRALEIGADRLLKATKVDGVYDDDPVQNPAARRYDEVSFTECLDRALRVMDQTAFALCRDEGLEVVVFDMRRAGSIREAALGKRVGTRITPDAP